MLFMGKIAVDAGILMLRYSPESEQKLSRFGPAVMAVWHSRH